MAGGIADYGGFVETVGGIVIARRDHDVRAVVEVDRVLVCVGGNGAGILPAVRRVVSDVQEGVLLEADVHESGLHTGQDVGHDPLVDVADD